MNDHQQQPFPADPMASEEKRAALTYVIEAFAEGERDGLDPDCMAHAALFAAFRELVMTYGEEAAAQYAECLPQRVRGGAFTTGPRH